MAAAYIVASWLLLQVAATVFPLFDAPAWVLKVFTTVLALGLPIAAILAWARDQQPPGSPDAGQLLTHMLQTRQESYFSPSYLCLASLGTGDVEAALDWAEKAVDELDPYFTYAGSLPLLAELRDRPRFTAALSRMGL